MSELIYKSGSYTSSMNTKYKIERKFKVEYIDDPKLWDRICQEKCYPFEPWEFYKHRDFEDGDEGEAISFYLCCLFNDRVFDVKMYAETYVNGEFAEELYIEPTPTIYHSLACLINKSREETMDYLNKKTDWQSKVISFYKKFIGAVPYVKSAFDDFLKMVEHPVEIWYNTDE